MILSVRTPDDNTLFHRISMAGKFFSFVSRELSEYVGELNPFYEAAYKNVVFRGQCGTADHDLEFFLFSGIHDKNFPWRDNTGL